MRKCFYLFLLLGFVAVALVKGGLERLRDCRPEGVACNPFYTIPCCERSEYRKIVRGQRRIPINYTSIFCNMRDHFTPDDKYPQGCCQRCGNQDDQCTDMGCCPDHNQSPDSDCPDGKHKCIFDESKINDTDQRFTKPSCYGENDFCKDDRYKCCDGLSCDESHCTREEGFDGEVQPSKTVFPPGYTEHPNRCRKDLYTTTTLEPTTTTLEPTTTTLEPTTTTLEPTTTTLEPTTTTLEPTTTTLEPTTKTLETTTTTLEPTTKTLESTTTKLEPTTKTLESTTTKLEPSKTTLEPTTTTLEQTTTSTPDTGECAPEGEFCDQSPCCDNLTCPNNWFFIRFLRWIFHFFGLWYRVCRNYPPFRWYNPLTWSHYIIHY